MKALANQDGVCSVSFRVIEAPYRLKVETMLKVREWERFKFFVDYEHRQVRLTAVP